MKLRKGARAPLVAAALCVAMLVIAFIASPHACEWGLKVYFWSGLAIILALAAIPTWLMRDLGPWKRVFATLGFVALGVAALIGSLVAADMQIICRLF